MMDRSEHLWERVRYHRERIDNGEKFVGDLFPFLQDLEGAWKRLEEHSLSYKGLVERFGDNPLSALSFLLELGIYPPPELLLALRDAYNEYLEAAVNGDRMTLEEALFGKPVRKAGTYALREAAKKKRLEMKVNFAIKLDDGLNRTQAAEATAERYGYDPDSILRMFRGVSGYESLRIAEE